MCTGRVDLSFIFRALQSGADGVIISGCWPGECHYVTEGNYDALANMHLCKKLLEHVGINPKRLRLEWVAASEGSRFAQVMDDFVAELKEVGPLGAGDGLDEDELKTRLASVERLIPYIKLVERERLRAPVKTQEAYDKFYASDETARLFQTLIADKLAISQILSLLEVRPRSTAQISEALGLTPSAVSKHMNVSARQGLVKYDTDRLCFVLA